MNMFYDGVPIQILPDGAQCKLTGENPLYMPVPPGCPLSGSDECDPNCEYYTEDGGDTCDNDCEHCDYVTCPKEEGKK